MKRLSGVRLQVKDPEALAGFYTRHLGMEARAEGDGTMRLGYAGRDADLILMPGSGAHTASRDQRYWKIGITLPNVDLAVAQLRTAGIDVSDPRQFLDIGYMAHLSDPEGFAIELLQWDFEANRPDDAGDPAQPLGGQARIGQITLRTGDMAAETEAYSDMRLLSVQDVAPYGFDLHFLAYTDEELPDPDVNAVENREWLWKRPYTTLEFQQIPGADIRPTPAFQGLEITG